MKQLLKEIADPKARGFTTGAVSINFCWRLTQPIKDRDHLLYEYSGPLDLTRAVQRKVTRGEITNRVSEFFRSVIKNKHCPKAYSLKRPADPVRS